jgi:hypothetical protein
VTGYKVYYGTQSKNYESTLDIGAATKCQISGLEPETTYYFAATAYDGYGNESDFSEELVTTIPSNDSDKDGLTDAEERKLYGTDPDMMDTDGDGISDGDEVSYWGSDWQSDIDGDGSINLLDSDADGDCICDGSELVQGTDPGDSTDNQSGLPPMVFGEVPVDHYWTYVELNESFQHAVIVATPMSLNQDEPAVVQIRNITSNSFEIRAQEYTYLDGKHSLETVSILVMEKGSYLLADGTHIEANSFETQSLNQVSDPVVFSSNFVISPVVISSIATCNGQSPVTGRVQNISRQAFEYCLQKEENRSLDDHPIETIGYIAWEPSSGTVHGTQFEIAKVVDLDHDFKTIAFQQPFSNQPTLLGDLQTSHEEDTANLRYLEKTKSGFQALVDEEESLDTETSHSKEDAGYVALVKVIPSQIIDNEDSQFTTTGNWEFSTSVRTCFDDNYQYAPAGEGSLKAVWTFAMSTSGNYEIFAYWTAHGNRAPDAPYTIHNNGNLVDTIQVDQRKHGGHFVSLGTFSIEAGSLEVQLSNDASGYVIADAVKIMQIEEKNEVQGQSIVDNHDFSFRTNGQWDTSTSVNKYYNTDYQYAPAGDGSMEAIWESKIQKSHHYEVFAYWTAHRNRASDAPYSIYNNGDLIKTIRVDQTRHGGRFVSLGSYSLTSGTVEVRLSNDASGYVIADAVKINELN